MLMDLRRLSCFLAVAEHGGFTPAARAMAMSQPAVSLAVKELESELGVRLFDRRGRRVQLTPAGEALLGPAAQVMRDLDTGRAAVRSVAGLESGSLSLCCLPTLAHEPVSGLVGRFRREHPGIVVELSAPDAHSDLVGLVRNGRCELGVADAAALVEDLVSHELAVQPLQVILPPGSRSGPMRMSELRDVPIVATPPGTSTRRLLEEAFESAGVRPDVAVVAAPREAILPLVVAGAGAAIVPEPLAAVARRLGAAVGEPVPAISRRVVLAHRPGPLAPGARSFVELALGGAPGPEGVGGRS
jgi:LysR family carnitine catabolism transcriptional activator